MPRIQFRGHIGEVWLSDGTITRLDKDGIAEVSEATAAAQMRVPGWLTLEDVKSEKKKGPTSVEPVIPISAPEPST